MFQLPVDLLLYFCSSNAILNCLDATLRTMYTVELLSYRELPLIKTSGTEPCGALQNLRTSLEFSLGINAWTNMDWNDQF